MSSRDFQNANATDGLMASRLGRPSAHLANSPASRRPRALLLRVATPFTRATEQGLLSLKLSKFKKKLSLDKQVPVTCYLRQLAQVSLILLKPGEGLEFYKKLSSLKHTEPVRLAMEKQTFGTHCGLIASFLAQMVPGFTPLDRAMSIWGNPFLGWMSGNRDVHDLCAMGMLATALKEQVKGSDFKGDGSVGQVLPELSFLDPLLTAEVKNEAKV